MLALRILLFFYLVQLAKSQASSVPGKKIIAIVGQPVLIDCHLNKTLNLKRIYWQDTEKELVLHVYNDGAEEFSDQDRRYGNRTSICRDLHQGNFSLLISKAEVKDDNTQITVQVQTKESQDFQEYCKTDLRVVAMPQKPEVNVSCLERPGEQQIVCTSNGSFPKPTLNWAGLNQREINPPHIETKNNSDGTYSIHSTLRVNLTKDQTVTCRVTNPTLQEAINTSIIYRDACPGVSPTNHVVICTSVLAFIVFVIFAGCAVVIHLYKRKVPVCCQRSGADLGPTEDPANEACLQEIKVRSCRDT